MTYIIYKLKKAITELKKLYKEDKYTLAFFLHGFMLIPALLIAVRLIKHYQSPLITLLITLLIAYSPMIIFGSTDLAKAIKKDYKEYKAHKPDINETGGK